MVGMNPRALGKLSRTYFHKTLTDLIRDRILKHAKWQLLHTLRPVKEVAYEVGFDDEFYFSRLFKCSTGCSPQFYREYETEIRGGKNLLPVDKNEICEWKARRVGRTLGLGRAFAGFDLSRNARVGDREHKGGKWMGGRLIQRHAQQLSHDITIVTIS